MSVGERALEISARAAGLAVMFVVLGAPGALLTSYPVMLALGVLHNDVSRAIPAPGYWATVLVLWGVGAALGHLRMSRKPA